MSIPLLFLSLDFQIPNLPNIILDVLSPHQHPMISKFYATYYFENFVIFYFFLFRVFDIFKPFPIGYVDKKFKNSFGIILDDILAGFYCVLLYPYGLLLLTNLFGL